MSNNKGVNKTIKNPPCDLLYASVMLVQPNRKLAMFFCDFYKLSTMSESLFIDNKTTKEERYKQLLPQIHALVAGETDWVANLANTVAALQQTFSFFWVGFYRVVDTELVLAPFQGPIACTRIRLGKGVCGTAWQNDETLLVDNVDEFPGHIACSSLSKSEIVIPIHNNGQVWGVLDIDSDMLSAFDNVDKHYLSQMITNTIEPNI